MFEAQNRRRFPLPSLELVLRHELSALLNGDRVAQVQLVLDGDVLREQTVAAQEGLGSVAEEGQLLSAQVGVVEPQHQFGVDSLHGAETVVSLSQSEDAHRVSAFDFHVQTEESLLDVGGLEGAGESGHDVVVQLADQNRVDFAVAVGFAHHYGVWLLSSDVLDELGGESVAGLLRGGRHHWVHGVGLLD